MMDLEYHESVKERPRGRFAAILHNHTNDRWHAPPPSGDLKNSARYRSIGHHTEGFNTAGAAQIYIEKQGWEWIAAWDLDGEGTATWDWDGEGTPAMVIQGPHPHTTW